MRAVLDANILVSAVISTQGAPAQLLRRWLAGDYELVVSHSLLEELERVLAYPRLRARVSEEEAGELVELLRRAARRANDPPERPRRAADPGDDYLIGLAEAERAVLVSGDRDLLELADRFPIHAARTFLDSLG